MDPSSPQQPSPIFNFLKSSLPQSIMQGSTWGSPPTVLSPLPEERDVSPSRHSTIEEKRDMNSPRLLLKLRTPELEKAGTQKLESMAMDAEKHNPIPETVPTSSVTCSQISKPLHSNSPQKVPFNKSRTREPAKMSDSKIPTQVQPSTSSLRPQHSISPTKPKRASSAPPPLKRKRSQTPIPYWKQTVSALKEPGGRENEKRMQTVEIIDLVSDSDDEVVQNPMKKVCLERTESVASPKKVGGGSKSSERLRRDEEVKRREASGRVGSRVGDAENESRGALQKSKPAVEIPRLGVGSRTPKGGDIARTLISPTPDEELDLGESLRGKEKSNLVQTLLSPTPQQNPDASTQANSTLQSTALARPSETSSTTPEPTVTENPIIDNALSRASASLSICIKYPKNRQDETTTPQTPDTPKGRRTQEVPSSAERSRIQTPKLQLRAPDASDSQLATTIGALFGPKISSGLQSLNPVDQSLQETLMEQPVTLERSRKLKMPDPQVMKDFKARLESPVRNYAVRSEKVSPKPALKRERKAKTPLEEPRTLTGRARSQSVYDEFEHKNMTSGAQLGSADIGNDGNQQTSQNSAWASFSRPLVSFQESFMPSAMTSTSFSSSPSVRSNQDQEPPTFLKPLPDIVQISLGHHVFSIHQEILSSHCPVLAGICREDGERLKRVLEDMDVDVVGLLVQWSTVKYIVCLALPCL
ncbi:uncharacterized protein LY89DRAFT_740327 [Mollisia scopiformis]|uniref:Uncharacterized protein n=1 Tax=Mollisia scopiformis TaxID=149040 RepID=A0A132BC06_MOLSC|nr:uncharacterized protein LY89DRAFT_740327 [Mollisia scopiformis]KUJ09911.1 hypothetical protein LY89DRAFT_740327 [Mollisia scopiformis]